MTQAPPFPPARIMVPVDLAEPSLSALQAAKSLGRASGSVLEVLYMQEAMPNPRLGGGKGPAAERWKSYRRFVEAELRGLVEDYPERRAKVHTLEGYATEVLSRFAHDHPDGMIVVFTHGYTGLRHLVFGSVAETMVRVSNVPVMTVHERKSAFRPVKMLVPMNLTEHADRSLRYAMSMADSLHAHVSVLHAVEGRRDPEVGLRLTKERLEALGAPQPKVILRRGPAEHCILEEAAVVKFDLIVLAAHRRRFWKDVILGMTAERVVRYSPIPVLSVPSIGA